MRSKTTFLPIISLVFSSTLFAQVTGLVGWDIYVDPGHSRKENVGIYGYTEAEKVLRVGLHLRDLLLTKTDIDTVYNSRFNDNVSVGLSQRTDEANSLGAAWFHSIHSDAGSPTANSTLMLWGQLRNGQEKTPPGGQRMSDFMIDILTRGMRIGTRGSFGDCSFYGCSSTGPYLSVNRRSAMPSELSEAGFHTSPVQNPRNMNAEWKRLEAYTLFWSILGFHGLERPPVGIAAGYIFDEEKEIPLNGATIQISGQEYTTDTFESLFHLYSNDPEQLQNGFYFIEDLPNETLEMIVSAEDFYSDTVQVAMIDSFFTFTDVSLVSSKPPVVVSTSPSVDETNVEIEESIIINFSRRMDRNSLDSTVLTISPAVGWNALWSDKDRRVRIVPDDLAYETTYTITVSGALKDLFDHPFDGNGDGVGGDDFSFSFTTEMQDVSPPQLLTVYPPLDAQDVENPPILSFAFDERLASSSIKSGTVILERAEDGATIGGALQHNVVNNRSVLSFFPRETLDLGAVYNSRVVPGLTDQDGNAIEDEKNFTFSTTAQDETITIIDAFETGFLDNWWVPQQSGTTRGIVSEQTSISQNFSTRNRLGGSTRSFKMNYGWDENAGSWLIREFLSGGAPREVWFEDQYKLQLYVFGDGGGNRIRFAVDDNVPAVSVGNHEVSPWVTIDWIGWRLVSWDMANDGTGNWLGDGSLDGALRIDSIQLTHVPGAATSGEYFFEDLRLVKAIIVDVEEQPGGVPTEFALFQNYPNPFNPATAIRYQIAGKPQHVRLVIYDALGRKIRTLVDEIKPAGQHAITWDGANNEGERVASGAYIYQMNAGGFVTSKKMVLTK